MKDAVKEAATTNRSQTIIMALIAVLGGAGAGTGIQFSPAHKDNDAAVMELQRQLDEHKRQFERALDRRDQALARYQQKVQMALWSGDVNFLGDDVLMAPPAAAMEAAEPEIEFEEIDPDSE